MTGLLVCILYGVYRYEPHIAVQALQKRRYRVELYYWAYGSRRDLYGHLSPGRSRARKHLFTI